MISIPVIRRHLMSDLLGRHIYLFGPSACAGAVLRRLADAGMQEGTVVLAEGRVACSRRGARSPGAPARRRGDFRVDRHAGAGRGDRSHRGHGAGRHAGLAGPGRTSRTRRWGPASLRSPATDRPDFVILGVTVDVRELEAVAGRPCDANVLVAAWLNALDRWSTEYAARGPAAVMGAVRFRPRGAAARREASPGRA